MGRAAGRPRRYSARSAARERTPRVIGRAVVIVVIAVTVVKDLAALGV
jgi:hypothetical protein